MRADTLACLYVKVLADFIELQIELLKPPLPGSNPGTGFLQM
jgi:hypothetical protein